jgi:hypothetical protein
VRSHLKRSAICSRSRSDGAADASAGFRRSIRRS